MNKNFPNPDFTDGSIELRFDGHEVAIYANREGMEKIIAFCEKLLAQPQIQHIHLEDYKILTSNSLNGTLAIFAEGD